MDKKKILFIVTLSERGGAQTYVFDLASNLDRDRYEILVASGGDESSWLPSKLEKNGIKYHKIRNLIRDIDLPTDILAIFEIRKLIKQFKPDIIHLNSSKTSILGSIAAKKCKNCKVVYTAHGFVFNESMSILKKWLYVSLERYTAKFKDMIITVSDFDKLAGEKHKIAPSNKIITVHNGIKIGQHNILSKEEARKELEIPQKYTVIGTISNYYPTKALYRLIEAAKIVSENCSNCKFALIGEGPEQEKLEELINTYKLNNNFFLGSIDNAITHLKAFDIFVLPSKKEGLPYTILEAMEAEVPIIATAVGGVPEIIINGENGFLVQSGLTKETDSETINQLAEKIKYYMANPNIAEIFANKATRRLAASFTLEKMVRETEDVYNNLYNK